MPPWIQFAGASATLSYITLHITPQYAPTKSLTSTFVILFLAQFLSWAFYWVVLWPRFFSPFRHLPTLPGQPFVGNFNTITPQPSGVPQVEWMNSIPNDGIIRYKHLFNVERLLITKPELVREVLVDKSYIFVKPERTQRLLTLVLGKGILVAEGEEHKRQRKLLMPAFAFRHTQELYPVFWAKSTELVSALGAQLAKEPEAQLEFGSFVSRTTLDIIGVASMGTDFGSLQDPHNKLAETYKRSFGFNSGRQFIAMNMILPSWLVTRIPTPQNTRFRANTRLIWELCEGFLNKNKARMLEEEKDGRKGKDIISIALSSGGFSDKDLINQMLTFLAAGHETISTATEWVMYELGRRPDIQTRLRAEIRSRIASFKDGQTSTISPSIIEPTSMPLLHAVCNETLRTRPPVPLTIRQARQATTLNGMHVPEGTWVVIAALALHRNKLLWGEDADEFKPERWLSKPNLPVPNGSSNGSAAPSKEQTYAPTHNAYNFLTFLHGPRSCIGERFARAELLCLVAAIIGRYEVELVPGQDAGPFGGPEVKGGITMRPKGGIKLKLKEVEGW